MERGTCRGGAGAVHHVAHRPLHLFHQTAHVAQAVVDQEHAQQVSLQIDPGREPRVPLAGELHGVAPLVHDVSPHAQAVAAAVGMERLPDGQAVCLVAAHLAHALAGEDALLPDRPAVEQGLQEAGIVAGGGASPTADHGVVAALEPGVGHAQRGGQPLLKESGPRLAGGNLGHPAGHLIGETAVKKAGAGPGGQAQAGDAVGALGQGDGPVVEARVGRGQARAVRQELAHGDRALEAGKGAQVARDRVVEADPPLVDQAEDDGSREPLAGRGDGHLGVGGVATERLLVDDLAVLRHEQAGPLQPQGVDGSLDESRQRRQVVAGCGRGRWRGRGGWPGATGHQRQDGGQDRRPPQEPGHSAIPLLPQGFTLALWPGNLRASTGIPPATPPQTMDQRVRRFSHTV
mgnify:CR=1 FL=1